MYRGRRGTLSPSGPCFRASIVKAADRGIGADRQFPNPLVDTGGEECRGGNSRTRWWTPAVRDAVKLMKESYRTFLACGTPEAAGRPSGAQLRWLLRQKPVHGRSSLRPWRTTSGRLRRGSGPPSGVSRGGSSTLCRWCAADLDSGRCGSVEGILRRPPLSHRHAFR